MTQSSSGPPEGSPIRLEGQTEKSRTESELGILFPLSRAVTGLRCELRSAVRWGPGTSQFSPATAPQGNCCHLKAEDGAGPMLQQEICCPCGEKLKTHPQNLSDLWEITILQIHFLLLLNSILLHPIEIVPKNCHWCVNWLI